MSEVLVQKVDDLFFIGKEHSVRWSYLYGIFKTGKEMKIQFKMGLEREGFVPFLDLGISKSGGKLITKRYRKPTHTQQYID